jgi:hypothetical protein
MKSVEPNYSISQSPPPPPVVNPYQRLGLLGNPFQVITDRQMLRRVVDSKTLDWVAEILSGGDQWVEIIGQRGWGKSTILGLVQDQVQRQSGSPWAASYVAPDQNRVTGPDPDAPGWVIDEAQRLRPACLRGIFRESARRGQRLILGTHESTAELAREHGLQIRTIQLAVASLEQVQAMFARRVAAFATERVDVALSPEAVERVWGVAAGNRRTFEVLMYELFCSFAQEGSLPNVISAAAIEAVCVDQAWS